MDLHIKTILKNGVNEVFMICDRNYDFKFQLVSFPGYH